MMLVQDYLKVHSLEDLEREHGVKARVHGHKMSLNYSMIESRDDDPLSQACRGLILRVADPSVAIETDRPLGETVVLARPFDRFFNLGQAAAAEVDINHPSTAFYEKMDGTLCIVYYDDVSEKWCVATRAVPEADLPIDGFEDYTFRTLFEKACLETAGKDFDTWTGNMLFRDTTYMFELTTPRNRIVVEYKGYGITLLAARKTATGKELLPAFVQAQVKVPAASRFRFGSLEEMVDFVSDRDPTKHEGIVACDHMFRRVKIKNAGYLALNKVRDSVMNSPRGLVELILLDKLDDALPLFDGNIVKRAEALRESFRALIGTYRDEYDACMVVADTDAPLFNEGSPSLQREHRKAFALAAQAGKHWMAPMMDQYQGRTSGLVDWIHNKRQIDGGWSNGFLDSVMRQLED